MADWYYAKNGQQKGPVSPAELKKLATSGEIGPSDLVFQEGGTSWVEANTVKGLFPAAGVAPRPAAPPPRPEPAREDDGELPSDDGPIRVRRAGGGGGSNDLLMFRQFVAPTVVIVLFWIGVFFNVVAALAYVAFGFMYGGVTNGLIAAVSSLIGVPVGILLLRVYCEILIVIFRLYDAVVDVRKELEKQRRG